MGGSKTAETPTDSHPPEKVLERVPAMPPWPPLDEKTEDAPTIAQTTTIEVLKPVVNARDKEADPNGKPPHTPGAKMDAGKAPITQGVLQYFPRALAAVSMVSLAGANKYAWKGWEQVPDGINRYMNAMGRHILAEAVEGPIDKDTKCLHKAQIAWNILAALELDLREQEK
jgi:hypothetical protein